MELNVVKSLSGLASDVPDIGVEEVFMTAFSVHFAANVEIF